MGRGSSKSGGGGGAVTQVMSQQGVMIDLSDNPLTYGSNDPTMSKAQRATVEAFEAKRVKQKIEYAMLVDSDGNSTVPYSAGDIKGKSGSVMISPQFWQGAEVLTHNHPRAGKNDSGTLGGTFSEADLRQFSVHSQCKTIRATAAEGTYSMSKKSNFNQSGFDAYVKKCSKAREKQCKAVRTQVQNDYSAKKINASTAKTIFTNAFNAMLVGLHNDFLAGQGAYGYTYTLEKTN